MKSFTLLFFFFLIASFTFISQSITINSNNNQSYCSGSIIQIPVTLTGNWGNNNVFKLKLVRKSANLPDSTVIVEASNNISPLVFQLPNFYADARFSYSSLFSITIEATNPNIVSNAKVIGINNLPQVDIKFPTSPPYNFYSSAKDEYMNSGIGKYIISDLYTGILDNSTKFKLNDSSVVNNISYFFVNPASTFTYSVAKIWNSCGLGRIVGNNTVQVKVNPFKIKIATIVPGVICEDRKMRIKFDYNGKFNTNNQFYIDVSNQTGSIVTTLTTFLEDSTNIYATLPNSFTDGIYRVRVRGTSPDAASNYVFFVVKPKPIIDLMWYPPYQEPIAYNYPVNLRINFSGSTNTIYMRISGGTDSYIVKSPNVSSSTDIVINVKPNVIYKVDSLVTACGVIKDYIVTGERSWNVRKDFYIEQIPKSDYCEGESLKFKIKSDFTFSTNNSFTVNLYDSYNVLRSNLPVNIVGDSLSFVIPSLQLTNTGLAGFTFEVVATLPQITSTRSYAYFTINKKPNFTLTNSPQTIFAPTITNIGGNIKGQNPLYITVNDGLVDKNYAIYTPSYTGERNGYAEIFVVKSQIFAIKSISDICGTTTYNTPQIFSTILTTPYSNYVHCTNTSELNSTCEGNNYALKFDTIGLYSSNNQFIITLNVNGVNYEVGRGNSSPITITMPSNLPFLGNNKVSGRFTITSSTVNISSQLTINRIFYTNIIKGQIVKFKYVELSYTTINENGIYPKKLDILKDEKVYINLDSSIPIIGYEYKINGKWFSVNPDSSPPTVTLSPKQDTTLYLEAIKNSCGLVIMRDTFEVKVKKYRINSMTATQYLCQGDQVEVFFGIEGDSVNRPTDFKMYIPYNNSLLELPIIAKKQCSYIVKIPEFPLSERFSIKILPSNPLDAVFFAKNYNAEASIKINRKVNLKLSALDGLSTLFYDNSSFWATLKVNELNARGVEWTVRIESIDGYEKTGTNNVYPQINIMAYATTYVINDVVSDCGYGQATGSVTLKRCYKDLFLPNYRSTVYQKEIFSGSFIWANSNTSLNLTPNDSILLSPTTYAEFSSGFEVKNTNTQSFITDIKGCIVIR